jgi:hypothetical protein
MITGEEIVPKSDHGVDQVDGCHPPHRAGTLAEVNQQVRHSHEEGPVFILRDARGVEILIAVKMLGAVGQRLDITKVRERMVQPLQK